MKLLPTRSIRQEFQDFSNSKRKQYLVAAILDFVLILVILIGGADSAKRLMTPLVSPLVNSVAAVFSQTVIGDSFAFIPGGSHNKYEDIDLNNLTALSFFDVPLNEEGDINFDSRGYRSFISEATLELFERARQKNVKIFLTLTAWEEDIIKNLLNSKDAQLKLADQISEEITSSGIDGITIDFEYPKGQGKSYQKKFTEFIGNLTDRVHKSNPNAKVAVAVPSSLSKNSSIYHPSDLSKKADQIFLIASDFIVPEVKNSSPLSPVYGFSEKEYWSTLSNLLGELLTKIATPKLVMERAWYGNGHNYPLYTPKDPAPEEEDKKASLVNLDSETIDRLVDGVPDKGKVGARISIPLIAKALEKEGILDSNVLAYALATIEHETDETFEPLEEIQGRFSARRLGYEGGMNYFGRGFIQLTHLRNYKMVGERIGLGESLVKHPELASDPVIAAKILAAFFKDNNVANLASTGNFIAARRPVNPDRNGRNIAWMAQKYEID